MNALNKEAILVAEFDKNSDEVVRVRVIKAVVGRYCDMRVWAKVRAGDGSPSTPTENGLLLDVDRLPELRRAIDLILAPPPPTKLTIKVIHTGGKGTDPEDRRN
jgi:hypothetical protein